MSECWAEWRGTQLSTKPQKLIAAADEALGLIEISLIRPVPSSFRQQYESEPQADAEDAPAHAVHGWLREAKTWLEQAIGLYALYQYPIVWEPIGVYPFVGFVDFDAKKFTVSTRIEQDNFIPFRLNVDKRLKDGALVDHGLVDLPRLAGSELHFPLFLLQRALWQRNIHLRFLETFLLLDHLTGQSRVDDPSRADRERLYEVIARHVRADHPEFEERIKSLKHIVLQAPLRKRLGLYLQHLGLARDDGAIRRMFRIRNDLAHARPVDDGTLAEVELETRRLARDVMRRELAARGITFGDSPTAA